MTTICNISDCLLCDHLDSIRAGGESHETFKDATESVVITNSDNEDSDMDRDMKGFQHVRHVEVMPISQDDYCISPDSTQPIGLEGAQATINELCYRPLEENKRTIKQEEKKITDSCDDSFLPITVAEFMQMSTQLPKVYDWPKEYNNALPLRNNVPKLEMFNIQPASELFNDVTNRTCHQQLNPTSSTTQQEDPDYKFFMSLLPVFKQLKPIDRGIVSAQIRQLIFLKLPKTS